MNQPTSGGQYVRDPDTGAITKVTEAAIQPSVTSFEPEIPQPVEKAAPVKRGRNV
ncbi:hypothetical protein [Agrobacterium rosae]|uniref:hypothetical protein n=1 Tax=Agrobacterium rosae TaxID=1972867 RepID=UPI0020348888|nr:hypothetical protein [Agrobacterium rosae]MCM2431956.1 hypothetical protein [Agrobacterium rosae]